MYECMCFSHFLSFEMENKLSSINNQKGLTLMEVVISLVFVAFASMLMANFSVLTHSGAKISKDAYTASQIASTQLELAKNRISNPTTLSTLINIIGDTDDQWSPTVVPVVQNNVTYTITTTFTNLSGTLDIISYETTVTWPPNHSIKFGSAINYEL